LKRRLADRIEEIDDDEDDNDEDDDKK